MDFDQPVSSDEKRKQLYLRQKELLDTFLRTGAISEAQYRKSFGDLTLKMGFSDHGISTKESNR